MRVPTAGQPLYERRIVREGKRIAERMLEGYSVTASGRFVRDADIRGAKAILMGRFDALARVVSGLYRRAGNGMW